MTYGRNVTNGCIDEVVACLDGGRPSASSIRNGVVALEIAAAIHASHRAGGKLIPLPIEERNLELRAV
jgi:hypothetical protein